MGMTIQLLVLNHHPSLSALVGVITNKYPHTKVVGDV